jgi:hypothetical protein
MPPDFSFEAQRQKAFSFFRGKLLHRYAPFVKKSLNEIFLYFFFAAFFATFFLGAAFFTAFFATFFLGAAFFAAFFATFFFVLLSLLLPLGEASFIKI